MHPDLIVGIPPTTAAAIMVVVAFAKKRRWKAEPGRFELTVCNGVVLGCFGVYQLLPEPYHNNANRARSLWIFAATLVWLLYRAWVIRRSATK